MTGILERFKKESGVEKAAAAPLLKSGGLLPSREVLIDALRKIYDPEIPVNIYDLGLIYRIDIDGHGEVSVDMTLTAPACPVAGTLPGEVRQVLASVPGVSDAEVNLVWDPPWTSELMSEEAQLQLGLL